MNPAPTPGIRASGVVALRLGGTWRDYAARVCECHLRPEAMRPNGNGGQSWMPLTSAQASRVRWGAGGARD